MAPRTRREQEPVSTKGGLEWVSQSLQTEIMAVLQCAYKAQEHGDRRNIQICSDSRAAIMALNGTTTTSLLVWKCFEALNNLATENRVTLLWIPGHSDIKGNEISDRLAKLAVRENFTGTEQVVGVSSRFITEEINSWLREEHQKEWNRAAGCKQVKALMGTTLNFKRAAELRKLGRNEVKVLAEILIGHGNLGYHRHKIGLADSPLCCLCESDISANSASAVLSVWRGLWDHA